MKTKTKFLSVLCALFMLIVSVMGLGGAIRAYGETEELIPYYHYFPEPVSDEEYVANPDESLTSLYYFSDYDGSEDIFENGFVRNYINQNPNIEKDEAGGVEAYLYYLGGGIDDIGFWDKMTIMWLQLRLDEIENAFIIFEVRESLPWTLGIFTEEEKESAKQERYEGSAYQLLDEMFSAWKDTGCKIMFISGADEVWFDEPFNAFLDHVDIHINVDLLTIFSYSVARDIVDKHETSGSVMIFDRFSSSNWFFNYYFIPYLRYVANINYICWNNIFAALGITAYYCDDEGTYYDIYGYEVERYIVESEVFSPSDDFIIAGIDSLYNETLLDLFGSRSDAEFYVYNEKEQEVLDVPQAIKYCGLSKSKLQYYLSPIMRDFILNDVNSLQKYDNWSGHCSVTFKPVFRGDGWLYLPEAYTAPLDAADKFEAMAGVMPPFGREE